MVEPLTEQFFLCVIQRDSKAVAMLSVSLAPYICIRVFIQTCYNLLALMHNNQWAINNSFYPKKRNYRKRMDFS